MADVTLSYTIPEAKVATAMEGFLYIYPNTEKDENGDPKYTDAQWVKEKIRRIIVRDVYRGLNKKAKDNTDIEIDNGIIT